MRILLDNSLFAHSQFAVEAEGPQGPNFGPTGQDILVYGFIRKRADPDSEYQSQKDALFTVGRLIREKKIQPFTYSELMFESMDRNIGTRQFDALAGFNPVFCSPAIERSRFLKGNLFEYYRKGGRKDKKAGRDVDLSQIRFMQDLCQWDEAIANSVLRFSDQLGLTEFENESIRRLKCFQAMCAVSQSPENFPDMFHLWTAQRNRLDVFLTLEKSLPSIAAQIYRTRGVQVEFPTKVMRPLQLLEEFGISVPDPVPIQQDRFYPAWEILR